MSVYAKVGGVPKEELIILEQVFCDVTGFKLAVDSHTYNLYIEALRRYAQHIRRYHPSPGRVRET